MRWFRLISLVTVLTALAGLQGAQAADDIYQKIDEAITRSPEYVARHELKIGEVRRALSAETTPTGRFQSNYRLYELYKPFVSDSAMFFLRQCINLADENKWSDEAARCRSLLAIRCSNIGMYDEAICLLDSILPQSMTDSLALGTYYEAYNTVYSELQYYTRLPEMQARYLSLAQEYEQQMFRYLPPTHETCFLRREQKAQGEGRLEESMQINDAWLKSVEEGSHPYALVALYRYIEYKLQRDTVQMMHWLTESVLADIRNAAMDQGSMWELANELMLRGDIDRASQYISFTSDCANRYGSRQRNWQIAPLLSHIAKEYKSQSERTTHQLWVAVAIVSILALLLLGVLFFLHRHRVKEEYIGRFMSLCSQYIDKLDNYRKMVNKKMKNKELEDLFRLSKSTELKEKELEELYENFDTVFLHLFPNFVDDFNALLAPEAQVRPKEENRLTTEMRIFALIRLGIEDSSKIAEFLHYSVNTIYNYRARIKNGALGNREHFERTVKELGLPK